jgi:pimeloyl-ACP methyl ester carboxylesterase
VAERRHAPTLTDGARAFVECSFTGSSGTLAALHYPPPAGDAPRLLAVHGWLDNGAGFAALAEALPECEFLALDLAGHGRSAWRPETGSYVLVDHLPDLLQVLDALQWSDAVLLGHSMGGAIATLLAVAAPERVRALICIDALGPLSLDEADAPARLRRALKARDEPRPRRRVFRSVEEAVSQRAQLNGLQPAAARSLVERGLAEVDGGFVWAADPRLQLPSAVPMSEAQVRSLLRAIIQPTLVLAAEEPDPRLPRMNVEERLSCIPQVQVRRLPGGHHLHLAEPEPAAGAIREFLDALAERSH